MTHLKIYSFGFNFAKHIRHHSSILKISSNSKTWYQNVSIECLFCFHVENQNKTLHDIWFSTMNKKTLSKILFDLVIASAAFWQQIVISRYMLTPVFSIKNVLKVASIISKSEIWRLFLYTIWQTMSYASIGQNVSWKSLKLKQVTKPS